jgi:hypothetical protein
MSNNNFPVPPKSFIPITEDQYVQIIRYLRDKNLLGLDVIEPECMLELEKKSKEFRKKEKENEKENEKEKGKEKENNVIAETDDNVSAKRKLDSDLDDHGDYKSESLNKKQKSDQSCIDFVLEKKSCDMPDIPDSDGGAD